MVRRGHVFRVAAQQDIRAAARHVGGDGDGAVMAGLCHDVGLLVMVLGVQHLMCLMPLLLQHAGTASSLFSTEMVPTSTGWPVAWRSLISSTTALNLPFSVR